MRERNRLTQKEIQTSLGVRTKLRISRNNTHRRLELLDVLLRYVYLRNILIFYVQPLNIRNVMLLNIRI